MTTAMQMVRDGSNPVWDGDDGGARADGAVAGGGKDGGLVDCAETVEGWIGVRALGGQGEDEAAEDGCVVGLPGSERTRGRSFEALAQSKVQPEFECFVFAEGGGERRGEQHGWQLG
jgi:hypothetical protein